MESKFFFFFSFSVTVQYNITTRFLDPAKYGKFITFLSFGGLLVLDRLPNNLEEEAIIPCFH